MGLRNCSAAKESLWIWPRRIMENYLSEGGAKSHENSGEESYSQGTELESNQGTFPTSSLGTWEYLLRKISELLQMSDCFPFCNGLFIFIILSLSYYGMLNPHYSANTIQPILSVFLSSPIWRVSYPLHCCWG